MNILCLKYLGVGINKCVYSNVILLDGEYCKHYTNYMSADLSFWISFSSNSRAVPSAFRIAVLLIAEDNERIQSDLLIVCLCVVAAERPTPAVLMT